MFRRVLPILIVLFLALAPRAVRSSEWIQEELPFDRARVVAVGLAPSDPSHVYIGMDGWGVRHSGDGGTTWSGPGFGLPRDATVNCLAVHPTNADHVLVGLPGAPGLGGVYRSLDAGATWSRFSKGILADAVRAVAFDPETGQAYAGGAEPGVAGIYRWMEGDETWTLVPGTEFGTQILAIEPHPSGSSVVFGSDKGWGVSADGGATWEMHEAPDGFFRLSWSPVPPHPLYAAPDSYWGDPLWSSDQGRTFEALGALPYMGGATLVEAHPTDPDVVLAGGPYLNYPYGATNRLWRTDTEGQEWEPFYDYGGLLDRVFREVVIDPSDPENLYLGLVPDEGSRSGTGLLKSEDGGEKWTPRIQGLSNYAVDHLTERADGTLFAVSHELLFRRVPGEDWEERGHIDWHFTDRIDQIIASPVAPVLFGRGYWRQFDVGGPIFSITWSDGTGWTQTNPPGFSPSSGLHDVAVDPTGRHVYVSHGSSGLFRNDDSGGTPPDDWSYFPVNPSLGSSLLAPVSSPELGVFLAGGTVTVAFSADGGETLEPREAGLPPETSEKKIARILAAPPAGDRLAVVYSDGDVYGSTDQGFSWHRTAFHRLAPYSLRDVSWDPATGHVFLAADHRGVLTSHPAMPAGLPTVEVGSVLYSATSGRLFVGTKNLGLWSAALESSVSAPPPGLASRPISISPSPFTTRTRIDLTRFRSSDGWTLRIFDAAGRLVWVWDAAPHGASDRVDWDGRDATGRSVASGVYFLELRDGDHRATGKVIKIR